MDKFQISLRVTANERNMLMKRASRNGWKMALLAWLERLKSFHEAAGDAEKASAIRSRIDLILSI
jgi:hypothetical protein